jgi:hypothetical protein
MWQGRTFAEGLQRGQDYHVTERRVLFWVRCQKAQRSQVLKAPPELKPTGSKGTKAGGNEKDKETKASTGKKKGWKAKFAELEAKMAAMSATTTSGGAKP